MNRDVVLVTGSSGFIARRLNNVLDQRNLKVRALFRRQEYQSASKNIEVVSNFNLEMGLQNPSILDDVSVVIHCAAMVHKTESLDQTDIEEFRKVNTDGTLQLARQAASMGVKRFIYLSSVKVHGEKSDVDAPFCSNSNFSPRGSYAISKAEAELGLKVISETTGMEVVIIRPPLVYGAGVHANFSKMLWFLEHSIPMPLGSITENKRSFVYIDNLVDLILICIDHPKASGEAFLVSDDQDLSTADLLILSANAMGKKAIMFKFPLAIIDCISNFVNMNNITQRLTQSLRVDISHTKKTLSWEPRISVNEGLKRTVNKDWNIFYEK